MTELKIVYAINSYFKEEINDNHAMCFVERWIGSDKMKFSVDHYRRMGLRHAISRLIICTWYEHQHYPHDPHQALHHVIVSRPPHFFSRSCASDPSVFALQWKKDDRSIVETLSDLVPTYFHFHLHNFYYFLADKNYRSKVRNLLNLLKIFFFFINI